MTSKHGFPTAVLVQLLEAIQRGLVAAVVVSVATHLKRVQTLTIVATHHYMNYKKTKWMITLVIGVKKHPESQHPRRGTKKETDQNQ